MSKYPHILQTIINTFDANNAIALSSQIVTTDSDFTFSAFHRTSANVMAEMKRIGLKSVETLSFPADGKTKYGDWIVPRAWDVEEAKLWINVGGNFVKIADRAENKCNVMMYSGPTPNNKIAECKIVHVNTPRKLWKGNFVFSENLSEVSPAQLAMAGATGVVTDFIPLKKYSRTSTDVQDLALWNNDYLAPANEYGLVGFQLTPRTGEIVRNLLNKNKNGIPARAIVNAKLYNGIIDFVTGVLPGTERPEEEVAVVAHLYEPGANDNASGCSAGLEALRTLNTLIRKKIIPPPRRSIRLCYTFEIYGTLAFSSRYPERISKIIAGINPDMVGADMEKCKSRLHVYCTPDSAPSYVDEVICYYIEQTFAHNPLLRWSRKPFFINDNYIVEPCIKIPTPALICLNDTYYHTNGDVVPNLSAETFKAIGSALTAYLYEIARGDYERSIWLVDRIMRSGIATILDAMECETLPVNMLIDYRTEITIARLKSVEKFLCETHHRSDLLKHIDRMAHLLQNFSTKIKANLVNTKKTKKKLPVISGALKQQAENLFPKKKMPGTFREGKLPEIQKSKFAQWSYELNAPVFWADGTRSVYEIYQKWTMEFMRIRSLKKLLHHFNYLALAGYIEYVSTNKSKKGGI